MSVRLCGPPGSRSGSLLLPSYAANSGYATALPACAPGGSVTLPGPWSPATASRAQATVACVPGRPAGFGATPFMQAPMSARRVEPAARPPPLLSPDMVKPAAIEQQRKAIAAQLAAGLRQASHDIARQVQLEKQELAQRAALAKRNHDVTMDQFVQQQALAMDEYTNMDIMQLQQAAGAEKSLLEQQAWALKTEYEARKAEQDMMQRRFEIESQFLEQNEPVALAVQQVQASMAAHGMPIYSKPPPEPVLPHVMPVPAVLSEWWKAYGYTGPAAAVPLKLQL